MNTYEWSILLYHYIPTLISNVKIVFKATTCFLEISMIKLYYFHLEHRNIPNVPQYHIQNVKSEAIFKFGDIVLLSCICF